MQRCWVENGPPVYMSVAGYLGIAKGRTSAPKEDGFDDIVQMIESGGGSF